MSEVKLTKTQLRLEQVKLERLRKYLPTLQLKKALLQLEVIQAVAELEQASSEFATADERVTKYASLLTERSASDLFSAVKVKEVRSRTENIAGVEIPLLEEVLFEDPTYSLFATPLWFESAILGIQGLITAREKKRIAETKKVALEKELREVSIRVNLFEKILIPRSLSAIKKIKIFLSDQQLAAVAQAKVAKKKIMQRKARLQEMR